MLVITQRPGLGIQIGNDILVTVLRVDGNHVRIGVDAPKNLAIRRSRFFDVTGRKRMSPTTA